MMVLYEMALMSFLLTTPAAIVSVNAYGPTSIKPISIFCQPTQIVYVDLYLEDARAVNGGRGSIFVAYQTITVYSLLMVISLMITHFQDPTRFIFEPHLGQAACLCCIPHVIQ